MDYCPRCSGPLNEKKRCKRCGGQPRTGEMRPCAQCSKEFYVAAWQMRDTRGNNQGRFCSRACKHASLRGKPLPWSKTEEKTISADGYVLVWAPDHPRANHKRVFEHILVAEEALGRPLEANERVHHKDHNRANNDQLNLVVLTNREHSALHALEHRPLWDAAKVTLTCPECGTEFKVKPSRADPSKPRQLRTFCSMECRLASLHRKSSEYWQGRREAKQADT